VAGSSSATCSPCTSPPNNSCNDDLDSVQYVDTGTCDAGGAAPACFYASSVVDCAYPTDNCVNGICTGFTCIPAEKNKSYPWDTAADDMGWALSGNWQHSSNWPYNYTEYYLQIANLNDGITTPADHVLLSPTFEFAACTGLTVNFAYWIDNNWAKCSPTKASLRLECGHGTSWTLVHEEFEMDTNNQGGFDIEADATACISEQVQFRFMVANMCAGAVNRIIVDEFQISVD